MDATVETLIPADKLAREGPIRVPGESADYTAARTKLLAEEIELRRHIERVAAQRRALPPGPVVSKDYRFQGAEGEVGLVDLFDGHDALVTYCWMFGPERARPCPICTQYLGALAANALDLRQRVGLAVIARSPVERLYDFAGERGWRGLPLFSDASEAF